MDDHPSFDAFDEIDDPRPEPTDFEALAEKALSRRAFLGGVGASAFVAATTSLTPSPARAVGQAAGRFDFKAVAANSLDTVTVPEGYSWKVLLRWGDPLWSNAPEFDHATRGDGASQETSFGDNVDGMELFHVDGRSIMAVNNEYANRDIAYGARRSKSPETADDVRKGKAAHGVSVFEVRSGADGWALVKDSPFNRRITANTPMSIEGPARGHDLMKTKADPKGVASLGTWNNCGSGRTPWGTYLACEENFNGYFSSSRRRFRRSAAMKRYGVRREDWGYGWAKTDERFDISKHPNEANRAGYVVEIDPTDPSSTPKKRTALGRFKHENAELTLARDGRVVVYMGDDERGEFLYRYVSDEKYSAGGNHAHLLDRGQLYVAKFDDRGRGRWIALTPRSTGMASEAEIAIHTRMAASAVGATTMDRPEWVAVNPHKTEGYCALTNNKNRGRKRNAGGDAMPVGGPNPRKANLYGQIVRWRPDGDDHAADGFAWDLFVMAGNPTVHDDAYGGSDNVTADNMFNAPDGLRFDPRGRLWIQTDGKSSNDGDFAGMGNNQMLVGDPESGEIRRFLVGPKGCEVTGLTWTADRQVMFVGIQHPNQRFPEGGRATPRSAIVAVWRDDKKKIV